MPAPFLAGSELGLISVCNNAGVAANTNNLKGSNYYDTSWNDYIVPIANISTTSFFNKKFEYSLDYPNPNKYISTLNFPTVNPDNGINSVYISGVVKLYEHAGRVESAIVNTHTALSGSWNGGRSYETRYYTITTDSGAKPRVDIANDSNYTLSFSRTDKLQILYIFIKAYADDSAGNVSHATYSIPINIQYGPEIPNIIFSLPPNPATNPVLGKSGTSGLVFTWVNSTSVYTALSVTLIDITADTTTTINIAPKTLVTYTWPSLTNGHKYSAYVNTIDSDGNISPSITSNSVTINSDFLNSPAINFTSAYAQVPNQLGITVSSIVYTTTNGLLTNITFKYTCDNYNAMGGIGRILFYDSSIYEALITPTNPYNGSITTSRLYNTGVAGNVIFINIPEQTISVDFPPNPRSSTNNYVIFAFAKNAAGVEVQIFCLTRFDPATNTLTFISTSQS